MNFTDIEYAGFRSWPAMHEEESRGIVLRSSNGFTKRANSANVLVNQSDGYAALVSKCEAYFFDKQLPCIFRLPSFCNNAALDDYLALQNYQSIDRSLVLYRSLSPSDFVSCDLLIKSCDEWIDSYNHISGVDPDSDSDESHLNMLKRIKDKTLMAVLFEEGVEVACGLGVLSSGLFGLFDIATVNRYRNHGYASKLLNGMLSWAAVNGATQSYLQVVAKNSPAVNLYRKLGYKDCYEYWYRIKHQKKLLDDSLC